MNQAPFDQGIPLLTEVLLGPDATTAAGKRYLQEILSVGGSRPALESFTAFRGREPSIDALLRHSGMAA